MVENSRVNVDGRTKNRMLRAPVQRTIPDIEQLFKDQASFYTAFANIDSLESERKIEKHRVAKITIGGNTEIYITAPEALIAHKLEETIQLCSRKTDVEKYNKDIKDLATMISGISKIYDKKELAHEIFDTIQEKNNSHFNEHTNQLTDIFKDIENDINSYINTAGLQDRLNLSDIRKVLGNVYSARKPYTIDENKRHSLEEYHDVAINDRSETTNQVTRETTQGVKTEGDLEHDNKRNLGEYNDNKETKPQGDSTHSDGDNPR